MIQLSNASVAAAVHRKRELFLQQQEWVISGEYDESVLATIAGLHEKRTEE
jgi:hypothetical protein